MMKRDDFIGDKRESLIMKARQELGLKKRNSSSRREILVPDRDMKTPLVISSTNPLGKMRPPSG